jgi:RHS repeat-associated protein
LNDTTAGIPAVIKEDSVYYIREPNGSLITRVSGSNTSYYHFDQLGSTRLLTDGSGTVTDEYAYDAYGWLLSHNRSAGSVDQPYQYVGQLGYYTHYHEPAFGLLQLGIRYFSPGLGQFLQRDSIKMAGFSDYSYGRNSPMRLSDPTGLQALIYPVFEMGGRCSDPDHAPGAAAEIALAQTYVKYVVQKLGLTRCPSRMKVHCYKKMKCTFSRRMNRECGRAGWHSGWNHMHVNFAPQCSRAMCIILHEMIHNCTGSTDGHKLHGQIGIPTCGADFGPVDPDEDYTPDDPL